MQPDNNTKTSVERAAQSVLGEPVTDVERLTHGDVNRAFRVETPGRAFVLKVFSQRDRPEEGKLAWVEARLAERAVPRAKLIHYTRDESFFPHGFSLSEHVEGTNCKQAVRDGRLSPFAYLELAGAYLRRVHDIAVPRYGRLGDGRGTEEDCAGWVLGRVLKEGADELVGAVGLGANLYDTVAVRVEKVLRRFERRLRPALVHNDSTPKNAILTNAGGLVFIDWDEAAAGPWLRDYTNLSYWYSYILNRGTEPRDKEEVRAAFFRGYGEPEFDATELDALEWALQTVQAVGVLSFHFRSGNAEGFGQTREILSRLLAAPPP